MYVCIHVCKYIHVCTPVLMNIFIYVLLYLFIFVSLIYVSLFLRQGCSSYNFIRRPRSGEMYDKCSEGCGRFPSLFFLTFFCYKHSTHLPVTVDDIDYINCHATSTPLGDAAEIGAINRLFSRRSVPLPPLLSSTKGATGHMLGAAGALEIGITCLSLKNGVVPPTWGLLEVGKDCRPSLREGEGLGPTFRHVMAPITAELTYALKNSFGFGGTNASIVLRKFSHHLL